MAKARCNTASMRAVQAFRKAHPIKFDRIETHKRRSRGEIVVRGYLNFGVTVMAWNYTGESLRRVELG